MREARLRRALRGQSRGIGLTAQLRAVRPADEMEVLSPHNDRVDYRC